MLPAVHRGDLLGAAIVLSSGLIVGALWVVEGADEGAATPVLDGEGIVPRPGAPLPADAAEFVVLRGEVRVGTVTGSQGPDPAGDGWSLRREMDLDVSSISVPGVTLPEGIAVSSVLEATLAADLTLATFHFVARGPAGPLVEASGSVDGAIGRVSVKLGTTEEDLSVPLASEPLVEEAAFAMMAADGALSSPGSRFRMPTLDPQSGSVRTLFFEVRETEPVTLADGAVVPGVKILRDNGEGPPRPVWVDPSGRMLKESMALGLVSLRRKPPAPLAAAATPGSGP